MKFGVNYCQRQRYNLEKIVRIRHITAIQTDLSNLLIHFYAIRNTPVKDTDVKGSQVPFLIVIIWMYVWHMYILIYIYIIYVCAFDIFIYMT